MPRILVIEDNPVEIETIRTRLMKKGYEVLVASNGEDGIRLAQEHKPDLIFMDMILPGMHGLEATIKLKQNEETKDIPIVALTVMDSSEFVATCFKEGISAFIRKPYDFEEIFEKTEKLLGIQRKTGEDAKEPEDKRDQEEVQKTAEGRTVLILENEPSLITMMTMSLMRNGYRVVASQNGISSLEETGPRPPDLILLDLDQLRDSENDSLEDLRLPESKGTVPLILITRKASEEEIQEKVEKLGARDVIPKPFSLRELLKKVEEHI
ncbi:MAG: response regulator [Candidatus Aminicenantales bacterium]